MQLFCTRTLFQLHLVLENETFELYSIAKPRFRRPTDDMCGAILVLWQNVSIHLISVLQLPCDLNLYLNVGFVVLLQQPYQYRKWKFMFLLSYKTSSDRVFSTIAKI